MRFTPSSNWSLIASSSNRTVTWAVSIRKITVLSDSLSSGTWIDVTNFCTELPSITQRIEYELGQFSSDSISFTVRNIDYFEANVFNASDSEYLELKVTAVISSGSTVASDTFYAFSGFIDKVGVQYDEIADTVSFDVFTADELGNRLSILNVNTQYINLDVDGASTQGLILPNISGIYVINANVTSYVAKVGLHTIIYESALNQINFDGGTFVTVADGVLELTSEDGLEKIEVYAVTSDTKATNTSQTDYIIVETAGDTLPVQPVYEVSLNRFIKTLYSNVGITTSSFDSLVMNTYNGAKKVSYHDLPPNDITVLGERHALVTDGTNLFVGVGNLLYKRTTSTGEYTLLATVTGSYSTVNIKKLFYNARNNHIYIVYSKTGVGDCARRYDVGGASLSSEVVLDAVVDSLNIYAMVLMDYEYVAGTDFKYGLLYNDVGTTAVKFLDDTSLVVSTVINVFWASSANASFVFQKTSSTWWILMDSGGTYFFNEITVNGSGTFIDNSIISGAKPRFNYGIYNSSEDTLYYYHSIAGVSYDIRSFRLSDDTLTTIVSSITASLFPCIFYASDDKVYATTNELGGFYRKGVLYQLSSAAVDSSSACYPSAYSSYAYIDRLYGLDSFGKLFQYHTAINMYVNYVEPTGSVRDSIARILQAFNLVATISAIKKVFVYRRGNDSGAIQTTGNNLVLNTSNTTQIVRVSNEYQKVLWVSVTSGETTFSYDGTNYNAGILADSKTLELSNELIPEEIVQDVAKYLFAFYNSAHDKYIFSVNVPLMQYEVMDGASVTFSGTKIEKTATGLIVAQTINNDGSQDIEVLF